MDPWSHSDLQQLFATDGPDSCAAGATRAARLVCARPAVGPAVCACGRAVSGVWSTRGASQPCRRRGAAPNLAGPVGPGQDGVQAHPVAVAQEPLESEERGAEAPVGALPSDQSADRTGLLPVSGEMVPRPILPMTSSKTKEPRFRKAPDRRETCRSVSPGHKPKHGNIPRSCFTESITCDRERESLKYQAAIGV
jgi:hypothetical protein